MSTPRTSVTSHTGHFIQLIILSDSKDEDTTLPVVYAPSSLDRVPALSSYSPDSDLDSEPTEDDLSDEDLSETTESPQTQTALIPFVQSPFFRQSPSTTSPSLPPSSSRNRSISPSLPLPPVSPPLPPVSPLLPPFPLSLPSDMLPPRKRVHMTSPQIEAMVETTILGLDHEGAPRTFEIKESSSSAATRILPVTEEMPLEHVEAIEDDTKTVQAILTSTKHQITKLLDGRDANRLEMAKLHSRAQDAKARLCNGYCTKGQKRSKTDKTEHGNGKSTKNQSRRHPRDPMIAWESIKIEGTRLKREERLKGLEPSPLHYK
ncbi:hypothetical protein Tco_1252795 [Tanacetum coccineum]